MNAAVILQVHHFAALSRANGPGKRTVIWVQGCTLNCPGCFNPKTHPSQGGETITVDQLLDKVLSQDINTIEGITFTGGEPLQQPEGLLKIIQQIREKSNLSVAIFSGYTLNEIRNQPLGPEILSQTDLLFAGRFNRHKTTTQGYLSSTNQTIHFLTSRYSMQDLHDLPEAELILSPDGEILFSGTSPLKW